MSLINLDKDTCQRIINILVDYFVEEKKDVIRINNYDIRFKRAGVIVYNTRTHRRSLVVVNRTNDLLRIKGLVSLLWVEFLRLGGYRNITVCISADGGITVQPSMGEEELKELELFLKNNF